MNKFIRKLKKLICNPGLFFRDSYFNLEMKLKKFIPFKYNGNNQYTVVTAVYNAEKYLNDYFVSLVNQTLNFQKHIYLILIDDGSNDSSPQIIKEWQRKYPDNIFYLRQKNNGISAARNQGIKHTKTKWVTFIDSDDFVHPDYFKVVDNAISTHESIQLVVGNLKFYFEKNDLIQDTHALRYRFNKKIRLAPINNLNIDINLFVTVSFFKLETLCQNNITFDCRIKPNFEDGKFLADYLLCLESGHVAYLKKAVFFYRKREESNSTIDTSWAKREKYKDIFTYGYLPMLASYKQKKFLSLKIFNIQSYMNYFLI